MRLSKRTEYGVRAVVQLARLWPRGFVQAKDLARQEELPNKFLEAILLALRRGGFLESKIGREGGYRLSRAPRDIRWCVVPHHYVADMDAYARAERLLRLFGENAQFALVLQRKRHRFDRPVEQHEKTVGLVDLTPTMTLHNVARHAIVAADELSGGLVA